MRVRKITKDTTLEEFDGPGEQYHRLMFAFFDLRVKLGGEAGPVWLIDLERSELPPVRVRLGDQDFELLPLQEDVLRGMIVLDGREAGQYGISLGEKPGEIVQVIGTLF